VGEPPEELRGRVVSRSTALSHVGAGALRGPGYVRIARGAYLVEGDLTHGRRIEAVRVGLGESPVLLGPSAAWAWGAELARPQTPVHVAVSAGVRRQRFLEPHRVVLAPDHVASTPYGWATTPVRTCIDVARGVGSAGWSTDWRVAAVDAVLHATGARLTELRSALHGTTGLHGLADARRVVRDARDGAESVRETLLRLLVVHEGFAEPELQLEVHDSAGAFVARLDMAWREARAAAEYDGAGHREPARHAADLQRHNRLRALGWRVLQVDASGMARPGGFLRQLAEIAPRAAG
jgi:very-short-patch-repair endonuclease